MLLLLLYHVVLCLSSQLSGERRDEMRALKEHLMEWADGRATAASRRITRVQHILHSLQVTTHPTHPTTHPPQPSGDDTSYMTHFDNTLRCTLRCILLQEGHYLCTLLQEGHYLCTLLQEGHYLCIGNPVGSLSDPSSLI